MVDCLLAGAGVQNGLHEVSRTRYSPLVFTRSLPANYFLFPLLVMVVVVFSYFMSMLFANSSICSRITTPHLFYLRTFFVQLSDPVSAITR